MIQKVSISLFLAYIVAFLTLSIQPASSQPSYCAPDPRETLVGCWRVTKNNGQSIGSFYVLLPDKTWFVVGPDRGVPIYVDAVSPTGLWSRPMGQQSTLVLKPVFGAGVFGNVGLPSTTSRISFQAGNNDFDETVIADADPQLVGAHFHWERLGNSFSIYSTKLDQAADQLSDAWNHGSLPQKARALGDFAVKCVADPACRQQMQGDFDVAKWLDVSSMIASLIPEFRPIIAGFKEIEALVKFSGRFIKRPSQVPGLTVADLISTSKPGRVTRGPTTQFERPGDFSTAQNDFNSLGPSNVRTQPNGTTIGDLPDGTTVNVRDSSNDGRPTVEIYNPRTGKRIKFRYTP